MQALKRDDLMPLERYHSERGNFRREVIAHKKTRQLTLGANARSNHGLLLTSKRDKHDVSPAFKRVGELTALTHQVTRV